jgi:hypothetical protein
MNWNTRFITFLPWLAGVGLLLHSAPLQAEPRTSANYSLPAESMDAGGGLGSSNSYRNLGSVGVIGAAPLSANYNLTAGYPAQTDGLPVPVLQVEQPLASPLADGGSRDFGVSVIGSPVALNFTLRNTGSASMVVSGVLVGGTHTGEFVTGSPGATTIEPGSATTMTVTFTPGAAGPRSATLTLTTNTADPEFTLNLTGTGNTPPTFAGYSVSTSYQTAATISLGKLLAEAADADGDAFSVTAAGLNSAQSGTAALHSGSILYTPPPTFSGTDTFSVTITDARGGTVNGTVTVSVGADPNSGGQGTNTPQITVLPGVHIGIAFQGIPGRSYQVQRSTNLTNWTTITTVVAASNGAVTFTDTSPPEGSAFYRLRKP